MPTSANGSFPSLRRIRYRTPFKFSAGQESSTVPPKSLGGRFSLSGVRAVMSGLRRLGALPGFVNVVLWVRERDLICVLTKAPRVALRGILAKVFCAAGGAGKNLGAEMTTAGGFAG